MRAGSEVELDETTAELARLRDGARAEGDWARADALRSDLEDAGWLVEDGPDGTRISRR
jgi:cysteinyl-tRNA synthetase